MAILVNMPRLSDTMEEGVVAKWLKQVGDKIEEGDILAEIETDKATMEFESFNEGTLLHIGVQEGETSPVDVLLAIIGEEGEDISEILNGAAATSQEVTSEDTTKEISKEQSATAIPEGVQVISMPRLSDTMEEGTVSSWLVNIGDKIKVPGVEASTGSLGHGIAISIGVALASKIKKIQNRIFVIVGDGECNEGTFWESMLLGANHDLDNLCCIIDYNRSNDRALKLDSLEEKLNAFGWSVDVIDGHEHNEIICSTNNICPGKPKAIIANTIKGCGVKEMENKT